MSISLRPVSVDEFPTFFATTERAFGSDVRDSDIERELRVFELDRSLAAYDGTDIVGTAGIFSLDLTVPGAAVPAAGVTFVGVLPTHRRRGILTSIMERQLGDIHDAGREPIAALWASESAIYSRYGYGLASRHLTLSVQRGERALRQDAPTADVQLRISGAEEQREALEAVYAQVLPERPGFFARNDAWWTNRLDDPEHYRGGGAKLSTLVAETTDGPAGYAIYRTLPRFNEESLPEGKVDVYELVAASPAVGTALWRTLLDMDLMASTYARVPVDEPLLNLIADPRRLRARQIDNLWVRMVDVPGALGARRYAVPVDVVLDVRDDRCKWNTGRWRLSGGPDGATCAETTDASDLTLGVEELGAIYLGGTSLGSLALAGRVEEQTTGAVAAASAAFGWHRQPYCPLVF